MRHVTLELRFVTPCFLGGADPTRKAEWRSASVRGQLRWWFRAVAGGRLPSLEAVKAAEEALFGSTACGSIVRTVARGKPATLSAEEQLEGLRLLSAESLADAWGIDARHRERQSTVDRLTIRNRSGRPVPTNPVQYLGYGCVGLHGLDRPCIKPGETAHLEVRWSDREWAGVPPAHRQLFGDALWAWLHLGGIGAKARNGFGSLAVVGIEGDPPEGVEWGDLEAGPERIPDRVRPWLATAPSQVPEWTHLSRNAGVFQARDSFLHWQEALAQAGGWLVAFRRRYGWPQDGRTLNGRTLRNRDYAWAAPKGTARRRGFPDRSGFGLPLPFGKQGETVTWAVDGQSNGDARRAAPLLIRVAQDGGRFRPVFTHLPALFLPVGAELRFKGFRQPSKAPGSEHGSVVGEFLDDLVGKQLLERIAP